MRELERRRADGHTFRQVSAQEPREPARVYGFFLVMPLAAVRVLRDEI